MVIKQKQTLFGKGVGNCFSTCIACLLDLPVEAVPNFCSHPDDEWVKDLQMWLNERGYFYYEVVLDESSGIYFIPDGMLVILSGDSPRGDFLHSVISKTHYKGGLIYWDFFHDPHPDNTFVNSAKQVGFLTRLL